MEVTCTKQFQQGKHIILPGEKCQAIFVRKEAYVDLYLNRRKIATLLREDFNKSFTGR